MPVVPHASSSYSYHFVLSQPNTPFQEYLANSPDGKSVLPVFGDLFLDEPIPVNGKLTIADLDRPGFGLTLNPAARAKLIPSSYLFAIPESVVMSGSSTTGLLGEGKSSGSAPGPESGKDSADVERKV